MPEIDSPKHLRLFVACSLPPQVKEELERAQAELRRLPGVDGIRWMHGDQFHLTLRFLGNVEAGRLEALAVAVRRACAGFPPLRLHAEHIGFFPNARRPRVIWAGVHDAQDALLRLQKAVESTVAAFTGEPAEGNFSGHVTLGRVKVLRPMHGRRLAQAALSMAGRSFGAWTADQVDIIRSELSSTGSRYTVLAAIPLAGIPRSQGLV